MSDDLDITGAVDGYLGGKGFDASVPVRQSVAGAIDANPQYEVELAKAAKATGVSMLAARAAPEEVKRQATIQSLDFGKLVNETPRTAAFLLDEDNARKSHDDIGALATFESAAIKAARYMVSADDTGGFARDLLGGAYHGGAAGASGVMRAASEFFAPPLDVLERFPSIGGNPLRRLAEGFGMLGADSSARLKAMSGTDESIVGGGVTSGVQSLGQNLMTLPLALLPGGQAAALFGMAGQAGGQSYNKARDKGVGQNTALAYGLSDAVIEYATEKLPLHQLLGDVKAGAPLLKALVKNAALEIPGEQIATVLQDMNEWAVLNPEKPFKDYLAERPSAAAQTLIATLIGTGGQVSLLHAVQGVADTATGTQRQAAATEQRAQALGELLKLAEASKLRERDPEAFATFAQSLVENNTPNLYVDPRALAKAGVDMAALAQSLPSIATQIEQATVTGGDLVIPTGEFLAAAPGQAYLQPLLDHARTSTDAMSPAEAKVYMQKHGDTLNAEIERVLAEKQGDEAFTASRDQVKTEFLNQLNEAKRFTSDVNKAYASMLGNFYAVQAARLGITPAELLQKYPLRVGAESVAGARVMDQNYEGAPDTLMGFSASGPSKVFGEQKYSHVQYVEVTQPDGSSHVDAIAGLNSVHAMERARRNWDGSTVKALTEEEASARDPAIREDVAQAMRSRVFDQSARVPEALRAEVTADETGNPEINSATVRLMFAQPAERFEFIPGDGQQLFNMAIMSPENQYLGYVELVFEGGKVSGLYDIEVDRDTRTGGIGTKVIEAILASNPDASILISNVVPAARGFWEKVGVPQQNVGEGDAYDGQLDWSTYSQSPAGRKSVEAGRNASPGGSDSRSSEGNGAGPVSGVLEQNPGVGARGQIALADDITKTPSVITLLKGADLSTFIHETGHFFLEVQADLAARIQAQIDAGSGVTEGEREIVGDMNRLLTWFGIKGSPEQSPLAAWHSMPLEEKRQHHEQFARGFEAYAFEGRSPALELGGVFQRFRAWLVNVYQELKALNVTLTDEVRSVMDRMLATTQQIQEAEAARSMGALFKTPEQAGMTLEEFKAYHELAVDATQQAIQNLQARGLRDMQWLSNARSRVLKDMQRRADGIRREVEREVRAEVMSQPIYRAWQFLTGKGEVIDTAQPDPKAVKSKTLDNSVDNLFTAIAKLGGLNRAEVTKAWGVDPKDKLESGVFGAPVVRKEGGLSLDAMLERLVEEGYLLPDEHGKGDPQDFEAAFDAQRRGDDVFSTWHDYARSQGDQPIQPLPENAFFGKLDTAVLKAMYGTKPEAIWRTLSTRRMTSEASGIHPDVVAETFGFSSGDELVKALLDAQPPSQVIEGRTDQRMLESHGDLGTPEGLQRATDQAVHSEARGRFMATELAALERASSVREKVPGRRSTVDVLARQAKATAQAVLARLRIRDIRPGQYAAAEARAGKAAQKALAAGQVEEAAGEKRNQLIQSQAARAAYAAQDEVRAAVDYLRRFEKRPKSVDPLYLDQIEALLERFDLNKGASLKAIDKRKTLMQWVEAQREQGMEPEIPPELLNEAMRQSWRDMTLEQLRGLRDTVKQIEHLGRLKNKLLTAKEQREFALIRDEIAQSIIDHAGDRQADTRTPATTLGRMLKAVKDFGAAHIKAATWARVFDGGKDGGPVWEYLIRSANERGDQETTMRGQATAALHEIIQPLFDAGKLHGKGVFFPELKRSLNREQIIAMALNTGNAGNIQRMLGGEGWTLQQILPALSTLTAAEWHAVQAIWDHFESYRPAIGAKEKRVYGMEPTWVEPQAFSMTTADGKTVDLRGGYYPIKYDPLASNRAEQHNDAEAAKRQLQGAYTSATTRRGFTKSRVEEVSGRPLLYSLAGVYSGVNDVIHDLAWHEWLIDANKILRSDKIDGAIREHYGPAAVRQLKTWVADVAAGETGLQAELDGALGRLRHGVSVAGLGFNVMSALMQPLGLTQSIVRVGALWIAKGMTQYIASPIDKTREVNGKSDFMAGRSRTRFRELNELRNQVEGQTETRRMISSTAYFLMMRCQQMVDVPTWLGAYEKAISEGNAEERAVSLADQAVIDAQGGGQTKDLSAIERGGPAQKLFTVFYSFMNTALNVGVGQTMSADTAAKKAKLAVDYAMLYSVPAVLGALLKDALTPGDAGDDDWRKLMRKLLGEQLSFLMGLMVVTREFGEAGKTVLGLSERPRDYSGPAGIRLIADATTLAKQMQQAEFDDQFRKAAVNLVGDLFALPAAQVNRTVTGVKALKEGKTTNPAAVLFGYQEPH